MTSSPPIELEFPRKYDQAPVRKDCRKRRGFLSGCFYSPRKKTQLQTGPGAEDHSTGFEHWWRLEGETVEEPNQKRAGCSGVQCLNQPPGSQRLLYVKRQVGHLFHSLRYPLGRPTVLREMQAYSAYRQLGIRVPELVYAGVDKCQGRWRGILVTEGLEGFVSLQDWYRIEAWRYWGGDIHQQMLRKLAKTLSRLHAARWQHGCLYPKHIFVHVDQLHKDGVEIALLDLEKSRRLWRVSSASAQDMQQLQRHRGEMPEQDWALLRRQYKHCLALRRVI